MRAVCIDTTDEKSKYLACYTEQRKELVEAEAKRERENEKHLENLNFEKSICKFSVELCRKNHERDVDDVEDDVIVTNWIFMNVSG